KVSKLPDFGAKSDRILYQSGLAVLRGAKMPAILMELGFLNHPTDRKRMLTDEFQDAVADAVVQGLKVYLGDGKAKEE
ncbi:MAG: N-acetylmuramoyl-L-alanine amidase, partial [Chthonomonadaceae bacterium]|nr:N-acetylmuramoyl-L-alanine amidase [Chthonomonadaceae bacterium]